MNVLVTGAQFHNKGAQSLLFSLMTELYYRYKNVEIYYLPIDDCFKYETEKFRFHVVFDDLAYLDYIHVGKNVSSGLYRCAKEITKWMIRHYKNHILRLSRVWSMIDFVIDISGYALTSNFELRGTYRYIRHINDARKRGIPVVLMPQSFGPFEYNDEKIKNQVSNALNSVKMIFAREADGVTALGNIGVTRNVHQSVDLVLQSRNIDWKCVYIVKPTSFVSNLQTENNVAIIPNTQLYRYGEKTNILKIYRVIIEAVLKHGKNVYIFRHSNDLAACEDIYEMFADCENVHLIRQEMSCLDYSTFIRQFDFIVASRFHSIVHAYREGIPAFVLGWAVKYYNLAALFQQEKFVFNVTTMNVDEDTEMIKHLESLLVDFSREKTVIQQNLGQIQSNNCYDLCDIYLRNLE